jgi:hypothetical protein
MKQFLFALAAAFATTVAAQADDAPVVVELFTSQGCSSCPPADKFMEVLAERDDVIALSLHVDYWDYIGWKDEFADPMHTKRQRAYANLAGRHSVYTPEMIVNGTSDIIGAKPMAVASAIQEHKATPRLIDLEVTRSGGQVSISARALSDLSDPMVVQMVRYQPERTSRITRGENAGKTIRYVNVAQDWEMLGVWDGRAPFFASAGLAGDLPVVILVQLENGGPIVGAARLP